MNNSDQRNNPGNSPQPGDEEAQTAASVSETAGANAIVQAPETPAKTIEQLQSELSAANAKIVELSRKNEEADAVEILVRQKMSVGLTRQQATAVIRRQKAWDESPHGRMTAARHKARQNAKAWPTA